MKQDKNKKTKGFTLIELVIAVLIIGVICAISLPMYFRAVEKSRATEAFSILGTIAKAQQRTKLATNEFTDKLAELDINLKSYSQQDASSFDSQYFDFTLGTEKAQAERKTGASEEYALNIDYETGKITCTPKNGSGMCARLGFEEVEESDVSGDSGDWPKTESCSASIYDGFNDSDYTCQRTLYQNGTQEDMVCSNAATACSVFNNDGNKTMNWNYISRRKNEIIDIYNPETGKIIDEIVYYDDGTIRGRVILDENGHDLYTIDYSNGSISSVYFHSGSGIHVEYDSAGNLTYHFCNGGCGDWTPPTVADIESMLPGRTETNCLDAFSDYPMACPNAS